MAVPGSLFRKLKKIVGPEYVTCKKEERLCYSFDATGRSFLPDAVIFPENEDQISRIFRLASEERMPVIPRGSGSGMTGGAVPVRGGWVVSTSRLNRILSIDIENFTARVQPGVIVSDIHQSVEEIGLFYPPDPASSSVCTIGGNVGECAGGPRAVKYGVTRDYVLGLRAVLPSGEIIKTGVATAKGVAGYDLTRLIVGSEGTLAMVTEITLRLLPKPERVATMAVFFDDMGTAAKAVSGIMCNHITPRCIEYLDNASLDLVKDSLTFDLPQNTRALLILEVDGSADTVKNQSERCERLCKDFNALDVMTASNDQEAQKLWQARKALSPILYKIARSKINEDIVVPISKIPDMVERIKGIQSNSGLTIVSFGHAGDGNIHCNIMYDKQDKIQEQKALKAVDELFGATLELGGTITGEHGVGLTKMAYLPMEIGALERRLMQDIKQVFDPYGILNPGKIFTAVESPD